MLIKRYIVGRQIVKIQGCKAHAFEILAMLSFLVGIGNLPLPSLIPKTDYEFDPYIAFGLSVIFERVIFLWIIKNLAEPSFVKRLAVYAYVALIISFLLLSVIAAFKNPPDVASLIFAAAIMLLFLIFMVLGDRKIQEVTQDKIQSLFESNKLFFFPIVLPLITGYLIKTLYLIARSSNVF